MNLLIGNHDKANKLFQEAETKPELTADQKQNENEFQEYLQSLKMTPTTRKGIIIIIFFLDKFMIVINLFN